jgi:hypothetical protein
MSGFEPTGVSGDSHQRGPVALVASRLSGNTRQPSAEAVHTAVPDVAGANRDQGLTQPQSRVVAGPRSRSSERKELSSGIFVALLGAADLLRCPVGSAQVRGFLEGQPLNPRVVAWFGTETKAGSTTPTGA